MLLALALGGAAHAAHEPFVARERAHLSRARAQLAEQVARPRADAVRALQRYTHEVDRLVRAADRQVAKEIGKAPLDPTTGKPVAYELFAMGSYGRRELAPFSDLDYGILTARSSPQVRRYFSRYARHLGDLLGAIDGAGRLRPCTGMSPTGSYGDALVDTPDSLASCVAGSSRAVAKRAVREREYIQAALSSTRPVVRRGRAGLHRRFVGETRALLSPNRGPLVEHLLPSLRDPFGLPAAAADPAWSRGLATPAPKDPERAINAGQVNIKHDILRAFQIPVLVLRQLHGIRATDTASVLRQLERRGKIEPALGQGLRRALQDALRLRTRQHLAAGAPDDRLGKIGPREQRQIREMVPLLKALRQMVEPTAAP